MGVSKVRKRDGTIVRFKPSKVSTAIEKSMLAVGMDDDNLSKDLAEKVIDYVNEIHDDDYIIDIEEIQDIVEKILIDDNQAKLAKAYILYRQKRAEIRRLKEHILGRIEDSKLNVNGLLIAKSRYLLKDDQGKVIETPKEMFRRVAKHIASAESLYNTHEVDIEELEEEFNEMIYSLEFIPSGRILANSGTKNSMLFSSFVIPIEDSMKGIFRALYYKALIQRLDGGTGFSFSRLRPKGMKLSTTSGYASGPTAFIKLFDHASSLRVAAGNRKPANMGSLNVEHPDIIEFVTMKDRREIKNFNISVEMTDRFMEAVKNHTQYPLVDPNTNEEIDKVDANNIFNLIVTMAWKNGDPGVLFIDRINSDNPLPSISKIETTDPCGDQMLLPYQGGNLGAINLSKFARNKKIKWKQLEKVTKLAVRFLDNTIDLSKFPVKQIDDIVKGSRAIGLGIMGFADMLYKLRIPYNSEKALETADKIMKFISQSAMEASKELANKKGVFPFIEKSIYKNKIKLRNSSLIAIAPTGSRSILAETSPGIEPNFALGYTRKILGSTEIVQINKILENLLKEKDIYSEEVVRKIVKNRSLDEIEIEENLKEVFVTAHDINPEWHIKMQSIFQKHIDNGISKTINFPKNATMDDIKKAFIMAYDSGCKGITVYREGSLQEEVISFGK
ncbi:adenosylcobalamin-dependent ribonucleoside-diphosphate reductase [archaeon]|nr:adenosylcobalamin-dependent ribonucleoside-diphosphate reductase [archaeon]MBT4023164.1 adenosylcobalamin-dependent ribonucleoside-diphosphate reductase [archaeon]MBT4272370.1 adenosylcobalamin-dependent ribonucleoside-diphosphate reductase [archaeon]MBT4460721.1 adenosylcobalamin-dependent ribonucleoside-diphosphate reductase [archaeon]MBT4859153.1 adenosylcobalamin-dependent ribonucleoside-diphosphate reductase [archaeon]